MRVNLLGGSGWIPVKSAFRSRCRILHWISKYKDKICATETWLRVNSQPFFLIFPRAMFYTFGSRTKYPVHLSHKPLKVKNESNQNITPGNWRGCQTWNVFCTENNTVQYSLRFGYKCVKGLGRVLKVSDTSGNNHVDYQNQTFW